MTKHAKRLVTQLPRSYHRRAAMFAARDGVSVEEWIIAALAEKVARKRILTNSVTLTIEIAPGADGRRE